MDYSELASQGMKVLLYGGAIAAPVLTIIAGSLITDYYVLPKLVARDRKKEQEKWRSKEGLDNLIE